MSEHGNMVMEEKKMSKASSVQGHESTWLGRWSQLGNEVKFHDQSKDLIKPEDKRPDQEVLPFPMFKVSQKRDVGSSSKAVVANRMPWMNALGDKEKFSSSSNRLDFPVQEQTTQNLLELIRPVRFYATVDSVQRVSGEINLPEEDGHQLLKGSMKLKGKIFGGYLDLFPNVDHQHRGGVRLQSLESSKDTEEDGLIRQNESSAETDILEMDKLQTIHLSGSISSSSTKGKGRIGDSGTPRTEIPDMNEEPPLVLDGEGETSNSATQSMNVDHFLSRDCKPTHSNLIGESGSNGWLIRFFDSAFFCEWIAVSYLYKHPHAGVRDYLCNRMYTLPLSGIESYLFQICYMMVHKPSPSLDKFVIDICAKSLKIALKVHWFLLAELEDSDDNEGISRIQEKCQIAATLMGEWSPLMRPQNEVSTPGSKNQVLSRLLSSKQKLFSLNLSPPSQKSLSFSPSPGRSTQDDGSQLPSEDNKIFKKLIPSPKVRDALMFRKSVDKDDEESEKEGFFKKLMRDSKGDGDEPTSNSEGFFKRLMKDNKSEDEEITNSSEGFFKRLLSSKGENEELTSSSDGLFKRLLRDNKGDEEELNANSESFFKRLLRENKNEDEDSNANSEGFFKKLFRDSKNEEEKGPKAMDDEDKDGFLKKLFKDKSDDKRQANEKNETNGAVLADDKPGEEDEREGFFKKFFKEKPDDKKDIVKADDGNESEGDESPEFSLFKRLFRIHPEDAKPTSENGNTSNGLAESSPGTENFFRKLFRDRDQSVEDSEIFGSKKHKEKRPGSPRQRDDTPSGKPPLPNNTASHFRKGAYHESLEFVQALCETSYGLVDIFPIEDRKIALRESLAEINFHLSEAEITGGICFPMGRGVYRVVHIPEDESILLNSREKAPYMISVEVLKAETPSAKDTSNSQKLSKGGIPLANGDAFLQKPPPWAYPLWTTQEVYRNSADRMSLSTAQAIDQAMTPKSEVKVKLVNVSLSVENCTSALASLSDPFDDVLSEAPSTGLNTDLEWVRVVVTADPGLRMESIPDPAVPRKKEHRRVPSTVAMEEVRAAAAKGEAPPGLPLKGAGQEDSSDAQPRANGGMLKEGDALSGELWEEKRERIRKASIYGKLPGWDLRSIIVKSGDDCRQEHLAVQLISHFYDIFQEAGLPLWLRPYEVLVTSSYTALIETIPDTASIHSIKSRYPNITSLRDFFAAKYKENSPSFKLAQRNFVESMAGYSLVCYLLQIKDRHNGNLLLDEDGHIIHIDFGFMLSNSPGGVNFESAPFKLTRELLEVMDSDADGVPSEFFDYFKVLCIQGFLTCRKHAERIILLVEMLQDSGFPCFKGGPRTIQNLRKRFHLSLTEEQCVSLVLSLISSSLDAWRTRQYDYYQRVLNGIL